MKRMILVLGLALFLVSTSSLADSVIRDRTEWLQPVDFTNLSYNDVIAVCPAPDFLCDGELNGIIVTGYTFASIEQITDLFNSYGIDPPLGPSPDYVQEEDSAWAPLFFTDFLPLRTDARGSYLTCIASTLIQPGQMWRADLFHALDPDDLPDSAFNSGTDPTTERDQDAAPCLYRPVPPARSKAVPTMPTYMLLFTILGIITVASGGLFRRKFKDG